MLTARPPMPDLPEYQGVLRGAVAEQRGVEDPEGRRFVPTSQVTVLLRPQGAVGKALAPQVFVGPADGPLRAAPADALTEGDGGVWRFRARADALFQGSGPKVVLALFAAEPVDAAGQTAAAVVDAWSESARIVRVPLDYDAAGGGGR
ncbi:MAG: hypothetical protein KC613_27865 [Myxococcales bacterium]|nr:hypothetical protein [Myxococcales bacterium]